MAMIQDEISAPVYFAQWSPDFEDILGDLQHSFITDDKSGTALEAMFNTVSSNGYQIGELHRKYKLVRILLQSYPSIAGRRHPPSFA